MSPNPDEIAAKIKKRILDPSNNAPPLQKLLAFRLLWGLTRKTVQIVPVDASSQLSAPPAAAQIVPVNASSQLSPPPAAAPLLNNTLDPALPG